MILEIIGTAILLLSGIVFYAKYRYDNGLSKFSPKHTK